jgi:hypothetical protein
MPEEDPYLEVLKSTGECRIPFRGEGQEEVPFSQLIDEKREYANELAKQIGAKIISNGSWEENIGHHLLVRILE